MALKKVFLGVFIFYFMSGSYLMAADIAIYGDSQHDYYVQRKIVEAVALAKPIAVFRVGDMVDDGNNQQQWDLLRNIEEPLIKTVKYYPALGNHEKNSPLYFKNLHLQPDQCWYSVEIEGIHFVIMDSNQDLKEGSKQHIWMVNDLKNVSNEIKYKVLIFHHPIFSVGPKNTEDEKHLKAILLPIIQKYGVGAVFSGHVHSYQHFKYADTDFVVTAGAGSRLANQEGQSMYLKKFVKAYHFCLLTTQKNKLMVRVLDINGKVLDDFKINPRKSQLAQ